MSELVARIKHFETHCIETNNPEGAEILHFSAKRIEDLDKKLDQAVDMLDTNARAHLLAEWAKPSII